MSVGAEALYPYDPEDIKSLESFRNDGSFLTTSWVEEFFGVPAMYNEIRHRKGKDLPFMCLPGRGAFNALILAEQIILCDQIVEFISPYLFGCTLGAIPGMHRNICSLLPGT